MAHDEIDLPVGDIRLKFDGGHGGHNGIRDVMQHINNNKFYRLRIGVGRPEKSSDSADYVLHMTLQGDGNHYKSIRSNS